MMFSQAFECVEHFSYVLEIAELGPK